MQYIVINFCATGDVDSDDARMTIADNPAVLVPTHQNKSQATDKSLYQTISPDTSRKCMYSSFWNCPYCNMDGYAFGV